MSILDNIFDQYLSLLIDILKESYDQKFIQDISNFIECEFKSLIISEATKNITPNDPNQKMHIVTPCFIIAFYRAFKNKLGNELSLLRFNQKSNDAYFSRICWSYSRDAKKWT